MNGQTFAPTRPAVRPGAGLHRDGGSRQAVPFRSGGLGCALLLLLLLLGMSRGAAAHPGEAPHAHPGQDSAASAEARPVYSLREFQGPPAASASHLWRVLTLRDYNTRVVVLGTTALGVCAGLVGVFALLRKRSLVGDVIGHASLPGVALAFIVMELVWPGHGRSLAGLLVGATVAGIAGVGCMSLILRWTRVKEDAALAMVLSVFFGLGMVLFTIIQNLPSGNAAGINKFIFGSAASMLAADAQLIVWVALGSLLLCLLLFKELSLFCFDEAFAAAQGWPTRALDFVLLGLLVAVAEIGAQSVGLVLVAALIIIPAAAARFWTDRLAVMAWLAAIGGGASASVGVLISALAPRFATGAIVVLVAGLLFAVSMLFGTARGVIWRALQQREVRQRVGRQDLLRAMYEALEPSLPPPQPAAVRALAGVPLAIEQLVASRRWSEKRVRRLLEDGRRQGVLRVDGGTYSLTSEGAAAALRAARNHRLWELYLIHFAHMAPASVDRLADKIEHVLGAQLVAELEELLRASCPQLAMPASPHVLAGKPPLDASLSAPAAQTPTA